MMTLAEIQNTPLKPTKTLLLSLISLIDLTNLNPLDTEKDIQKLCDKGNLGFENIFPAAICTFSTFGNFARTKTNQSIRIAAVGGCFPTGVTLSQSKINEVESIAKTEVDEIDIVLNRGDYLSNQWDKIQYELSEMKKVMGLKQLKVILETGDFKNQLDIQQLAEIAINAGADFIKTSTGKSNKGATPEAVYTMCQVIHSHYNKTGIKIGIKPSGGIRTTTEALLYYKIVQTILGDLWLTPKLFRIGASSLYDQLISDYKKIT